MLPLEAPQPLTGFGVSAADRLEVGLVTLIAPREPTGEQGLGRRAGITLTAASVLTREIEELERDPDVRLWQGKGQ